MAIGTLTKIPTQGINANNNITCIVGATTGTTLFICKDTGVIKQITNIDSTTIAAETELTNKVKLPGKIVALGAVSFTVLIAILSDGRVYTLHTDGTVITLIANLNMSVVGVYVYGTYAYAILNGMQQERSNVIRISLT
jgi:hypothetical protein